MDTEIYYADAAVIGGSLGGVQAAISLLEQGRTVFLSEFSPWIGGQLTSQAVPPDEHPWIEDFGCTRRYREFRDKIRESYRNNPHFDPRGELGRHFDPGHSTVSRLSHLPSLSYKLLMDSLAPYLSDGRCTLLTGFLPLSARVKNHEVLSVKLKSNAEDRKIEVRAGFFIDGTDQGDLLPLTDTAYSLGAESRRETGEPSAPVSSLREDLQPVTWVLSLGLGGKDSPIEKPGEYDYFRSLLQPYDSKPLFSRFGPDGSTGKAREFGIIDHMERESLFSLWSYRRIQNPLYYPGKADSYPERTLLNWPQNDYILGNIIENDHNDYHYHRAKQFSFSFLYWLQTEAPRPDGARGYPEISLVKDILGTPDGAAQFPYIREGRRIKALTTITEQDLSASANQTPKKRHDSVGLGSYHLDMHLTTVSHTFYYKEALPFEIPLGALIPIKTKNLLPASKNIGTTHISNGCFRLHPVEWNIGEVSGYMAHFCLEQGGTPGDLHKSRLLPFQDFLREKGVETEWPHNYENWKNRGK